MDYHYPTMNRPAPNPLIMHYIHPPPPPLSTPNSSQQTPPVNPPPHYRVLSSPPPPPPKEKRRHGKHKPPRLENNCTPVVDSSVFDNFKLILILAV